MSRITRARVHPIHGQAAEGLKGELFDREIAPCTLLAGVNGAGKSSTLFAIIAAIEGLATTPTDPRRPYLDGLPANTGSTVFTDEGSWTRDLAAISTTTEARRANADAARLVGKTPTAWNLSDFAASTDGERNKVLDIVARAGGAIHLWTMPDAIEAVRVILADEATEAERASRTAALSACTAALTSADTGEGWLKAAESWAIAEQAKANAAQRAAQSYAEELAAQAPAPAPGDAEGDKATRDRLLGERAALDASAADRARVEAAIARHAAEGPRLLAAQDAALAEGKRLAVAPPPFDGAVPAEVTARLAAAEAAFSAPVPDYDGEVPADPAKLRGAVATTAAAVTAAAKTATAAKQSAEDARKILLAAQTAATQADGRVATLRGEIAALRSLSGADATCAHCGQTDPLGIGERINEAEHAAQVAMDEARAKTAAAFTSGTALDAAELAREKADAALATARAAQTAATQAVERAEAQARAGEGHTARVMASRQADLDAARAAVAREEARITQACVAHDAAEAARLAALEPARARYRAAKAAYETWQATVPPTLPEGDSAARLAAIAAELAEIEDRETARNARLIAVNAAKTAVDKATVTKSAWEAFKALTEALRQARNELASAAYGPIEKAARSLVSRYPQLPQPYFAGPSDYGADIPGRGRIPLHSLSASQHLITAGALVYALATVAKNPCRMVLLDNLDVVQADHRILLLTALAEARTAGLVDTVICCMATEPEQDISAYRAIPGLTVDVLEMRTVTPTPAPAPVDPAASADTDCPF